jgi:antitoxin-like ribbon-helix-helix protein
VRVGRRQIAGWFAPEVARQLHMIALEEDTTLQALMAEAGGKHG